MNNHPFIPNKITEVQLKAQLQAIEAELSEVRQKTVAFETILRTKLANELVEIQELTVLYKQQKKDKKLKRLNQKKRGKNYIEPIGLMPLARIKQPTISDEDAKEMKRLYREALVHVHPDKFSLQDDKQELATEVTIKLIDIYKSGDLHQLKMYHQHIFGGNALDQVINKSISIAEISSDDYLKSIIQNLEHQLDQAKSKYTYKVLSEYDDPLTFVDELKAYYEDKLIKLRRRTRSI